MSQATADLTYFFALCSHMYSGLKILGQIFMQTTGVSGKIILKIRLGTATKGRDFRLVNKINSVYFWKGEGKEY